ncbi:hypothetical protein D046_9119, partial [Vibrio parahaemolyticus V-223/04]
MWIGLMVVVHPHSMNEAVKPFAFDQRTNRKEGECISRN